MKVPFNSIKNKFKKLVTSKKTNSHDHWRYLLNIFLLMIIILIISSLYLLYKIRNQEIFQVVPTPTETTSPINENLLTKIKDSFSQKILIENEITEGGKLYVDPSQF